MKDNKIKTDRVYLSLGDREERTANAVMRTVGDCIRAAKAFAWVMGDNDVSYEAEVFS